MTGTGLTKREYNRKWKKANAKKVREYNIKWRKANPEKICKYKRLEKACEYNRQHVRLWRLKNPNYNKERYLKNPGHGKEWRVKNLERYRKTRQDWKKLNPEKVAEYQKRSDNKRIKNPKTKLNHNIGVMMRKSLKNGKAGYHWELLVGYNLQMLKIHLEKQFTDGMTWKNYGQWHVDHAIPISAFNFEKPEDIDFKQCWALKNLQPLWAEKNLQKSNKLNQSFQQSLALG